MTALGLRLQHYSSFFSLLPAEEMLCSCFAAHRRRCKMFLSFLRSLLAPHRPLRLS